MKRASFAKAPAPTVTFVSPCECIAFHGINRWVAKTDLSPVLLISPQFKRSRHLKSTHGRARAGCRLDRLHRSKDAIRGKNRQRVFVGFDHVASIIANASYGIATESVSSVRKQIVGKSEGAERAQIFRAPTKAN